MRPLFFSEAYQIARMGIGLSYSDSSSLTYIRNLTPLVLLKIMCIFALLFNLIIYNIVMKQTQILFKRGNILPAASSLMFSCDYASLPSMCCYLNAPYCDYKSFSYCSREHVYLPVEVCNMVMSCNLSSSIFSSLSSVGSLLFSSLSSVEVMILRRYYDSIHYNYVVACYDVRLKDGSYILGVPEFLLFSSSDVSLLVGRYLVFSRGYIYLVSSYDDSVDGSPLFDSAIPDKDSSLSSHFFLSEFLRSDHCSSDELYSCLTRDIYDNLVRLVELVLQPARNQLGCPIYVSSGFRSSSVNKAIGGSPRSYHLYGRAADVYVPSSCARDNADLYDILSDLPHVELIRYSSFIHVAF